MISARLFQAAVGAALLLCLGAAAPAPADAPPPPRAPLDAWFGLSMFDHPAGYGRLALERRGDGLSLGTEVVLRLKVSGAVKRIEVRTEDETDADLTLRAFDSEQTIDGVTSRLKGRRDGNRLTVEREAGGRVDTLVFPLAEPLYPESAADFLATSSVPGQTRRFLVFSLTALKPVPAEQRVDPAPAGEAGWSVVTRSMGEEVVSRLGPDGVPQREQSQGGMLVSVALPREKALAFLKEADRGEDFFSDRTLLRLEAPLPRPETIAGLTLLLEGVARVPDSGPGQFCRREGKGILCRTRRADPDEPAMPGDTTDGTDGPLAPSPFVQSDDPRLLEAAGRAANTAAPPWGRAKALSDYVYGLLGKSRKDVGTALDALREGEADCQGHALLYTALARASGLPTRVANGIVYTPGPGGFAYHSWAETLVNGRWIPVDPTFGQAPADALRLRLSAGEGPEAYAPVLDWLGIAKVRVLAVER